MPQEKILTESGLRDLLALLKQWMPFIKSINGGAHFNDKNPESDSLFSIGIGGCKCGFDLKADGSIYILNNQKDKVKLQDIITPDGSINLTMAGYKNITIDGEGVNNQAYDILDCDTIQKAIKKLDLRSGSKIIERETHLNFPTIGKMGIIYRSRSTGKQYIWNVENYCYEAITPDVINGGNACD